MINYNLIYKIYKKNYPIYLNKLILILNKYHKVDYSNDFWEPIIGIYIRKVLSNFYLVNFINKNKIINKVSFNYKKIEFAKKYIDLDKNKSFSYLLNKNLNFLKTKKNFNGKISYKITKLDKIFNGLKLLKLKFLININVVKIVFTDSYFNKKNRYLFILKNFFSFYYLPKISCENYNYNNFEIFQNRLNLIDELENKYDQLLQKLIFFIPINYLEGFQIFHDEVKKIPICKAIYTDGDEVKHDFIKFFIGFLKKNKKTKILFGQHSFRSGLDDYDLYFDYIKSICSYYLTWGWSQSRNLTKSFGSLRIYNSIEKFKNLQTVNSEEKTVCLILSSFSIFGDCLYENYFENINAEKSRINLLRNLKQDLNIKIYLKPRSGSFLLPNKVKFYRSFKTMSEKTKLQNIYKKFQVIIFERLSLGIIECIYLDQPSIFYYPNNLYQHKNSEFKSLILLLKKSNLYFNKIEDLKDLISDKNKIQKWWNNKKNKFYREKIIKKFGLKISKKNLIKIKRMAQ